MIRTLPNDKIIITVAMTGALVTKEQHPDLPVTPDEIAECAKNCVSEGAAICHIHGKDKQGQNTSDVEVFKEIKQKVRAKSDAIIQFSTGGGPNLSLMQTPGGVLATASDDPMALTFSWAFLGRIALAEGDPATAARSLRSGSAPSHSSVAGNR